MLQRSVAESLEKLQLDAVDLLLLHWPNPEVPLAETMAALNDCAARGWARHIGVSNFTTAMLAEATRLSDRPLATDQVEYHPFLSQRAVLEACRAQGMALTAYCPLARGRVFKDPTLARIAQRPPANRLVGFELAGRSVPREGDPVVRNGRPVGRVTSAKWSPLLERTIGLAWVPATDAVDGARFEIRSNDRVQLARVVTRALHDPDGTRLRS